MLFKEIGTLVRTSPDSIVMRLTKEITVNGKLFKVGDIFDLTPDKIILAEFHNYMLGMLLIRKVLK